MRRLEFLGITALVLPSVLGAQRRSAAPEPPAANPMANYMRLRGLVPPSGLPQPGRSGATTDGPSA